MSYKETDVMHETENFWVLKVVGGYEVYKIGATHSTRCDGIYFADENGLKTAIEKCNQRQIKFNNKPLAKP